MNRSEYPWLDGNGIPITSFAKSISTLVWSARKYAKVESQWRFWPRMPFHPSSVTRRTNSSPSKPQRKGEGHFRNLVPKKLDSMTTTTQTVTQRKDWNFCAMRRGPPPQKTKVTLKPKWSTSLPYTQRLRWHFWLRKVLTTPPTSLAVHIHPKPTVNPIYLLVTNRKTDYHIVLMHVNNRKEVPPQVGPWVGQATRLWFTSSPRLLLIQTGAGRLSQLYRTLTFSMAATSGNSYRDVRINGRSGH